MCTTPLFLYEQRSKKMASEIKPRNACLVEAAQIISGDRDAQYGKPEDNFLRIAKIWSVILGVEITQEDVAMMMVGLKVARYANKNGFQDDTWIDIAGYAACGYEVGEKLHGISPTT